MNTYRLGFRPFLPTLLNEVFERQNESTEVSYKPATNVLENEKWYKLEVALPGFTKEEISIRFEEDVLIVSAGHETKENAEDPKYTWNEFGFKVKYQRSFQLPETVDADGISAAYENGILLVTLPKKEVAAQTTRQIAIS